VTDSNNICENCHSDCAPGYCNLAKSAVNCTKCANYKYFINSKCVIDC